MEKVGIGSKLCPFGKRKDSRHWLMSHTASNSLSITVIIQKYPASYIPFSLTDGKKGIADKLIQWKNSDVQNVLMKGPSGKTTTTTTTKTTTQMGNYVILSLYYLENGKGENAIHCMFLENLQSRALTI